MEFCLFQKHTWVGKVSAANTADGPHTALILCILQYKLRYIYYIIYFKLYKILV